MAIFISLSRSCDCLAQSELSSALTPRNEQMPPNPESQFLHFKRVDISLETSDSEATSSAGKNLSKQTASMRLPVAAVASSSTATSEPLTTASVAANQQERQSRLMQQQDYESHRDRSKSPRPQTLPGLKMSASTAASSEDRRPTSPLVSSLLYLHSLLTLLLCYNFNSSKHAVCTNFLFIWVFC